MIGLSVVVIGHVPRTTPVESESLHRLVDSNSDWSCVIRSPNVHLEMDLAADCAVIGEMVVIVRDLEEGNMRPCDLRRGLRIDLDFAVLVPSEQRNKRRI
ncbi:hypothetical protein D3C74_428020 [compost metagenome]